MIKKSVKGCQKIEFTGTFYRNFTGLPDYRNLPELYRNFYRNFTGITGTGMPQEGPQVLDRGGA